MGVMQFITAFGIMLSMPIAADAQGIDWDKIDATAEAETPSRNQTAENAHQAHRAGGSIASSHPVRHMIRQVRQAADGLDSPPGLTYVNVININILEVAMSAFARCREEWEHPRPLWIVLLLLTLWFSWPLALGLFVVLLWTGRLEAWKRAGLNMWQEGIGPTRQPGTWWPPRSSGNHAFDHYRSDTLRRLEEEEKEFREFLNRLRAAKDKTEFDQFMSDRRNQAGSSSTPLQS